MRHATTTLAACALLALGAEVGAAPQVLEPRTYPAPTFVTGAGAHRSVLADLDGDGRLDAAVSNTTDDTVTVLRGRGDGTLVAHLTLAVGDAPRGLVAADLDGDGWTDLAVADRDSADVLVLLNAGDGTFQAPAVTAVGAGPGPLAAADMDGDGTLDLVVGLDGAGAVTVLLGQGDGSFTHAATVATGPLPSDVALGDLDADGLPDVVVTDAVLGRLSVLRSLGGGALAAPVDHPTNASPNGVALADLDGDGHVDAAVACTATAGLTLLVRFGAGDGSLGPQVGIPSGAIVDVAAADVDGDGDMDLLATGGGGFLQSVRNDGGGSFSTAAVLPAGQGAGRIATGDLDGDGAVDVVAVRGVPGDVCVLLGGGDGSFDAAQHAETAGFLTPPDEVLLLLVDDDAAPDVVVLRDFHIQVLRGLGDGTFAPPLSTDTSGSVSTASAGDVDGDGHLDLAVVMKNTGVRVWKGVGDGTFQGGQNLILSAPRSVLLSDLDADGDLDLAATTANGNGLRLYRNSGTGQLSVYLGKAVGTDPRGVRAGDFDGDGLVDLVVLSGAGSSVAVLRGLGGGAFADAGHVPTTASPFELQVLDLDEDGHLDLVVSAATPVVHLGLGDGTFAAAAPIGDGELGSMRLVFADVDGDGRRDVLALDVADGHVLAKRGAGDGTFGASQRFVVYPQSTRLVVGDLDADQGVDVVTASASYQLLSILLHRATLPWLDLGGALPGIVGTPLLDGTGDLAPGTAFALTLSSAAPASVATLVAGLSAPFAPFKGGVLVPAPDVLLPGFATGASGGFTLAGTWPADLPSGMQVTMQAWIVDAVGPAGFAASNGLRATTP